MQPAAQMEEAARAKGAGSEAKEAEVKEAEATEAQAQAAAPDKPALKETPPERALRLARALGLPCLERIPEGEVAPELAARVPPGFAKAHRLVLAAADEEGGLVTVAVADPLECAAVDDLGLLLGRQVRVVVAPESEILDAIGRAQNHAVESAEQVIADLTEDDESIITELEESEDLLDSADEAPIIRLVNLILFQAVRDKASDIHIEPYQRDLKVRFRIDGVLHERFAPPKRHQALIISRLKIMAKLNIAEKRLPQDGRIRIKVADRDIDVRVSIIPTAYGESIVLRLLDKTSALLGLEELGMGPEMLSVFNRQIQTPHGIILVTGPTGSGKSTTLYAALSRINSEELNIITVEDPIEYQLPGVRQMQVNAKIDLTFAKGLRSFLRHDPDVIMVGEIRDLETAEIAIQASLTGHLVFSTLHTNDSAGAMTRLVDMGIEPFLISSSVLGVLAQRLVRVICSSCKEPVRLTSERLSEIGLSTADVPGGLTYRGTGCSQCLNTGYRGRTGIYELLVMDDELRRLVVGGADANQIRRAACEAGMKTLRQDGATKVIRGITSIEEILRVTQ
jgi:general secretion pathway protein E